jgi:hypothetical protein
MMLSVLRLYSVCDGMINAYGAVGRMKIDRRNQSTWKKACTSGTWSTTNHLAWDQLRISVVESQ